MGVTTSGKIAVFLMILWLQGMATAKRQDDTIVSKINNLKELCEACQCNLDIVPYKISCSSRSLRQTIDMDIPAVDLSQGVLIDLDYSDNEMDFIDTFPSLPLHILSFRNNRISVIKAYAFQNLDHLAVLDLSYNRITDTSFEQESFAGKHKTTMYEPHSLKELNLGYNKLTEIERTSFVHLSNLEVLILDGNNLGNIDDQTSGALISLEKLRRLSLTGTGLKAFDENLALGLKTLEYLNLANNNFREVPSALTHMESLTELDLSGNRLKTLDASSFRGFKALTRLELNNLADLRKVDESAFGSLGSLQTLIMSNNTNLKFIHPDAFEGINPEDFQLRELNLKNNLLRYLPEQLVPDVSNWYNLNVIDLQGNPWACDCHSEWMMDNLTRQIQERTPSLVMNLRCGVPKELLGVPVLDVTTKHDPLQCDPDDNFNPYEEKFGLAHFEPYERKGDRSRSSRGTSAAIAVFSVLVIIGTFCFVGGLYLQKKRQTNYYRSLHNMRFQQSDGNLFGTSFTSSGDIIRNQS